MTALSGYRLAEIERRHCTILAGYLSPKLDTNSVGRDLQYPSLEPLIQRQMLRGPEWRNLMMPFTTYAVSIKDWPQPWSRACILCNNLF